MLKPARPDVEARRDYFTSNDINASESNLLDMTTLCTRAYLIYEGKCFSVTYSS